MTVDYDEEYSDTALSDKDGNFYFPEKSIKSSRPGKMLDESRTRQVIGLTHKGKRYLLWYTTTSRIVPEKVIVEKLADISCDLNNATKFQSMKIHLFIM